MSSGPWQGAQFDMRDYDPHRRPERSAGAEWRKRKADQRKFQNGAIGGGGTQTMKYVRSLGNDEHLVEHPSDPSKTLRVAGAEGGRAYSPGQRVIMGVTQAGATIIGNPPAGEKGVSNAPSSRASGELDLLGLQVVSPNPLQQGLTTPVTLLGFGFKAGDTLIAVEYDPDTGQWSVNSDVSISNLTITSSSSGTADITVASSVPFGSWISYEMERG